MITHNPTNRATITDVLNSTWYNNDELATLDDAKALFLDRNLQLLDIPPASVVYHSSTENAKVFQ
jgi:hypothetical protein